MIIYSPQIITDQYEVTVSANVEFKTPLPSMPDELWFKFPISQKDMVTDRADGFLIAMLLLAMQYGEDIQMKGTVSPRLLTGIKEYQRAFNMWLPKKFRLINIQCDTVSSSENKVRKDTVVSAFSGGVDSFFTLRSHLPGNDDDLSTQITHTLFVHGFDIKLEHGATFSVARDSYAEMFKELKISFLTARTNLQQFGTRPNWGIFHGTALIGLAHILGRKTTRFYVPASGTYRDVVPWGSDCRIDHLLSTESLEVVHDGAGFTRVKKIEVLSRWPETYKNLRVCCVKESLNNCSLCEKCLRTMVTLELFGALQNYSTFTLPIENKRVRKCRYFHSSDFVFPMEIIEHAIMKKRWGIAFNIYYAIIRSRILQPMHFLRVRLIGKK